MSIIKSVGLTFLISVVTVFYAQNVRADEGFFAEDFLEMPEVHQKFWLSGAMDALAHVAAFKKAEIGQCVVDWYFGEGHAERNSLILASFEKYSEYPPTAILVSLAESACGDFVEVE